MNDSTSLWDILGTLANIVASIGTVGALILAVRVYNKQVEDARSDQASRVFVSLENVHEERSYGRVVVDNTSDRPIFHVRVSLARKPFNPAEGFQEYQLDRLPAKEHWSSPDVPDSLREHASVQVRMSFEDAAGHWWVRDSRGELMSAPKKLRIIVGDSESRNSDGTSGAESSKEEGTLEK